MKKLFYIITLLMGLLGSQSALAECSGDNTYAVCADVLITGIYIDGENSNWVYTSGNETLLSCTPDSGRLIKIPHTRSKSDWILSTLITAHIQKLPILIRTNTSGVCEISYVVLGDSQS